MPETLLIADVGGTNSKAAVVRKRSNTSYKVLHQDRDRTTTLANLVLFLYQIKLLGEKKARSKVKEACISIAGPLDAARSKVKMTNAEVSFTTAQMKKRLNLSTLLLLNDFESIGYGIDLLKDKDVCSMSRHELVSPGSPAFRAARAVIGPGTGLGVSLLVYDEKAKLHRPVASEGGHMLFSPANDLEWKLYHYVKDRVHTVRAHTVLRDRRLAPDTERFVSGPGLSMIYDFIYDEGLFVKSSLSRKLRSLPVSEKNRMIDESWKTDPASRYALELFVKFLARASQNIAVMSTCFAGFYLAGGLTIYMLDFLRHSRAQFMKHFTSHERREKLLRQIPVFAITTDDIWMHGNYNAVVNF